MDSTSFIMIIIISLLGFVVFAFLFIKVLLRPQSIDYLNNLVQLSQYDEAVNTAKRIIHKNPRNCDARYLLGKAYQKLDQPELTLEQFEKINKIGIFSEICKETVFREEIAMLYSQFGKKEEALKEYLVLMDKVPGNASLYYHTAKLFEERGNQQKAIFYYQEALKRNDQHVESWLTLGRLYSQHKKNKEARRAIQNSLKIQSDNPKAHFYLGEVLKDMHNYQNAVLAYGEALKDSHFRVSALIARGFCYQNLNQHEKAVIEWERGISLSPYKNSKGILLARYNLAKSYIIIRKIDEAVKHWKAVYKVKPHFMDVSSKIQEYSDLQDEDVLKDFLTVSNKEFGQTCRGIASQLNIEVEEEEPIIDGIQLIGQLRPVPGRPEIQSTKKLLWIIRPHNDTQLSRVRHFYEEMKEYGITQGMIISSTLFASAITSFVANRHIDLIDRQELKKLLRNLPAAS